jgi:hypothetical protein
MKNKEKIEIFKKIKKLKYEKNNNWKTGIMKKMKNNITWIIF